MRRFLVFLFCISLTLTANAGKFRELGMQAAFSAYKFDGKKYLIFKFKNNENRSLLTNTIIRFKLANGEEIRLKIDVSTSSLFYYAQFELNPDIEKMLAWGSKKSQSIQYLRHISMMVTKQ